MHINYLARYPTDIVVPLPFCCQLSLLPCYQQLHKACDPTMHDTMFSYQERVLNIKAQLENDRFEHRTSNIGNIGLQAAHRTSDCYTAPIPIRQSTSLSGPACQLCLFAYAWLSQQSLHYCSTVDHVKQASERGMCLISVSDARVRQTTA